MRLPTEAPADVAGSLLLEARAAGRWLAENPPTERERLPAPSLLRDTDMILDRPGIDASPPLAAGVRQVKQHSLEASRQNGSA